VKYRDGAAFVGTLQIPRGEFPVDKTAVECVDLGMLIPTRGSDSQPTGRVRYASVVARRFRLKFRAIAPKPPRCHCDHERMSGVPRR
jgi:hypothetical protein